MRFSLTLALVAIGTALFAQNPADIFHKTVDLDAVNEVSLDVYANDNYEVRQWPGDDILVETSVKITNAKPSLLQFFLENNRYDLGANVTGDRMQLISTDKTRRQIQGREGTTTEDVAIVVYMPEEFTDAGSNTYRRKSK
ncbi:hypothetical protein [Neolewinella antarctica]|uniref:Uncharacterized protein n=1 Tax=Neolewinella antarctica TaxID=442734 RepID=A0ABX0XCC6_9BACT|nr:hypothetical protein [Neolewinella antarctica]NJC26616.1 hypothetical protein [Neolewinella antarctica]